MPEVALQPWSEDDLPLLQKLLGDPQMMVHLGGAETPEQILRRHQRYLRLPEAGIDHMFKILWGAEAAGNIGYWRKTWQDQAVYEMGWLVLPDFQGQGIATKAAASVIEIAIRKPSYPFIHAFPSVENRASNAICRKLGFAWIEECQLEYPPGRSMLVNNWRLRLLKV